ncbi:hypothetical protein [Tissierella sp.]|uniref:hypothetical protein n=1 Tax=Tissierella sp. TaxID=41274 RepID=UPI0028608F70|nr:hypothetical protein [Tissierella sp.]MDR7857168.1 hypothetical protein [Tissierella sp.]
MKKNSNGSKEIRKIKERQRVLDNFYTKQMKKGKTTRADILDKISLGIVITIFMFLLLYKIIGSFIISMILGLMLSVLMGYYVMKLNKKTRCKKIEQIKNDYKLKLEEEKVLLHDEDIEDYIVNRYYEKKTEIKSSVNFFSKDKVFKLYLLFLIFYVISYFTSYKIYYKIMAVLCFATASFIGAYNITEYIREKENKDLLN